MPLKETQLNFSVNHSIPVSEFLRYSLLTSNLEKEKKIHGFIQLFPFLPIDKYKTLLMKGFCVAAECM